MQGMLNYLYLLTCACDLFFPERLMPITNFERHETSTGHEHGFLPSRPLHI